jgi:dTDP-4-amino-4,6-dideoxygalactose transaminase
MLPKLAMLDEDNEIRRQIAKRYLAEIKNPKITLPVVHDELQHVWHLFTVHTENRDLFQQYLLENGVQTVIHYPIPPHKQVAYRNYWNDQHFPISDKIHETIISIPISPVMSEAEIETVIRGVNSF